MNLNLASGMWVDAVYPRLPRVQPEISWRLHQRSLDIKALNVMDPRMTQISDRKVSRIDELGQILE